MDGAWRCMDGASSSCVLVLQLACIPMHTWLDAFGTVRRRYPRQRYASRPTLARCTHGRYTCAYPHAYAHMHIHMRTCAHAHMRTCAHAHTHPNTSTYAYMHTCMQCDSINRMANLPQFYEWVADRTPDTDHSSNRSSDPSSDPLHTATAPHGSRSTPVLAAVAGGAITPRSAAALFTEGGSRSRSAQVCMYVL